MQASVAEIGLEQRCNEYMKQTEGKSGKYRSTVENKAGKTELKLTIKCYKMCAVRFGAKERERRKYLDN